MSVHVHMEVYKHKQRFLLGWLHIVFTYLLEDHLLFLWLGDIVCMQNEVNISVKVIRLKRKNYRYGCISQTKKNEIYNVGTCAFKGTHISQFQSLNLVQAAAGLQVSHVVMLTNDESD